MLIFMEEKSENEKRIRALTKLYYSNPKVQENMINFAQGREVSPRYFEGFGKRPDTLQYPSDIMGLVTKGATSLHCSEEIWSDPLQLSSEITKDQMDKLRKGWDLLIDIDSKYFEYSTAAAKLIIQELENHGINNYGIKYSGSKGWHIIVSGKAFPEEFESMKMKESFPDWPRAICQYLINKIRPKYNKIVSEKDIGAIQKQTNLKREEITDVVCPNCSKQMQRDKSLTLKCSICGNVNEQRKSTIARKRVLRCSNESCLGPLEIVDEQDFFFCNDCKISNRSKIELNDNKNIKHTSFAFESDNYTTGIEETLSDELKGGLDLVLVAPRHLFRMPYSLHEKTSLASIVVTKEELENFSPRMADPLKIKIRDFMPPNTENEAEQLLSNALAWKRSFEKDQEEKNMSKYKNMPYDKNQKFEEIDPTNIEEKDFPDSIKKLLKGLKDGRKRGLFVLITFLRTINFAPDRINLMVREWNKLNEPQLKEGYVKSQIDWHLKQSKKILPPNYENDAFYRDIGIISKRPEAKSPIVEMLRKIRSKK